MGIGIVQKFDAFRSRKLLDSAKGQTCQNCDGAICRNDTVVSAHSNWGEHGKGGSIKAADCFIAWLGDKCHFWLDQGGSTMDPTNRFHYTEKLELWQHAQYKTLHEMFKQGIIIVK